MLTVLSKQNKHFLQKPQFRTSDPSRLAAITVHTTPTRHGGFSACVRSRLPTTTSTTTTPLTTACGLVVEHTPADPLTQVRSSPPPHRHAYDDGGPGSQKPDYDGPAPKPPFCSQKKGCIMLVNFGRNLHVFAFPCIILPNVAVNFPKYNQKNNMSVKMA